MCKLFEWKKYKKPITIEFYEKFIKLHVFALETLKNLGTYKCIISYFTIFAVSWTSYTVPKYKKNTYLYLLAEI